MPKTNNKSWKVKVISRLLLQPSDFTPSFDGWEVEGALNPGAVRMPDGKIVLYIRIAETAGANHRELKMCPRIISKKDFTITFDKIKGNILEKKGRYILLDGGGCILTHMSHFRKVILERDGFNIDKIEQAPAFLGTSDDGDYGVEDPRISKIGNTYVMTFVGVSAEEGISTYITTSKDMKTWGKRWLAFHEQNKDVVLFPEKIKGRYVALHRPEAIFSVYRPSIWISYSPDLVYWGDSKVLIRPRANTWETQRIGSGPPPLKTKKGWLLIYHGVSSIRKNPEINDSDEMISKYCAGALLLDLKNPEKILARSPPLKPLLEPTETYEETGFMNQVVFPTGLILDKNKKDVLIYSGGADSVISVKKLSLKDIFDSMEWY